MDFNFHKGNFDIGDPRDPLEFIEWLRKNSRPNWEVAAKNFKAGLFIDYDENVIHLEAGWPAIHAIGMAMKMAQSQGWKPMLIMCHPQVGEEFMDHPKLRGLRRVTQHYGKPVVWLMDMMVSSIYEPDVFICGTGSGTFRMPPNKGEFIRIVREEAFNEGKNIVKGNPEFDDESE